MPADCALKRQHGWHQEHTFLATVTASESQAGCCAAQSSNAPAGKAVAGVRLLRRKSTKTKDIRPLRVSGLSRGKSNGWRYATAYPWMLKYGTYGKRAPPLVNESGIC
jgi:hypothetical protein